MIKCSKYDMLKYIYERGMVENWEIAQDFDFRLDYTSQKLRRLRKQKLVINLKRGHWELTFYGIERLRRHDKEEKDRRRITAGS